MLKQAGSRAMLAALVFLVGACERYVEEEEGGAVADAVADSIAAQSPVLQNLPPGADREQLEIGLRAYAVCSVCHGPEGHGTPLGPPLRNAEWIHIDGTPASIAQIIQGGVPTPREFPIPMPVMGGGRFEPDEFDALVAYVHALSQT